MSSEKQSGKKNIFNKAALEKLNSPEKLDTMVRVTEPISWMGLVVACVLSLAVVLWSIFGSFTEKADGVGLILDSAGVVNICHAQSGKLHTLMIKTGDYVHKGKLIARIEQPAQTADTQMTRYNIDLATNDRDAAQSVHQYNAKRQQEITQKNVYSSYEGIVDEVMVQEGNIISAGSPICSVRITQNRNELSGVFYISVDNGKRIEPNMTIQLAPNGVDTSQTGSLIGIVRSISQYPLSAEGVVKSVGNSQLAQHILSSAGGAVMEIHFDLVKDKDSESGYLWTSVIGKHKPITPGSYCTGYIIIDRQPPIEKVFYKISQLLRSR